MSDCYIQRAVYVSEPTGAQQFFLFQNANPLVGATGVSPAVPGVTDFDNGTSGEGDYALGYRNTYHWDRRQCAALNAAMKAPMMAAHSSRNARSSAKSGHQPGLFCQRPGCFNPQ